MEINVYCYGTNIIIPTVAKTDAGYFLDVEPVEVIPLARLDSQLLSGALRRAVDRGNPVVKALSRDEFKTKGQVVLEAANAGTWKRFHQKGYLWGVSVLKEDFEVMPTKRNHGFVDDAANKLRVPRSDGLNALADELLRLIQGGGREP